MVAHLPCVASREEIESDRGQEQPQEQRREQEREQEREEREKGRGEFQRTR